MKRMAAGAQLAAARQEPALAATAPQQRKKREQLRLFIASKTYQQSYTP
ncbi:hypothetical protein PQQ86_24765 [Paraburkholderia sediminicola]